MSLEPASAASLSRLGQRGSTVADPGQRRAPRTKPYRLTVDLPPAVHTQFSRWIIDTEEGLGHNVDKRRVVLALLDHLVTDEEVSMSVARNLR